MTGRQAALLLLVVAAALLFSSCLRAPSVDLAGSFFPVWLLCAAAGIIAAALIKFLFRRMQFEHLARPAILFYPALAVSSALTLWLIFFS